MLKIYLLSLCYAALLQNFTYYALIMLKLYALFPNKFAVYMQWRIQHGAFGANAPMHLVEEPAMLLIKLATKLCVRPRLVY